MPMGNKSLFRSTYGGIQHRKWLATAVSSRSMGNTLAIGRTFFAAMTCFALIVWSVVPSFTHAPTVIETIQDHLEMIESHGHSHGLEEDIYWALHGHGHDVADHDHNQAFLSPGPDAGPFMDVGETWRGLGTARTPSRLFRIERPPRA